MSRTIRIRKSLPILAKCPENENALSISLLNGTLHILTNSDFQISIPFDTATGGEMEIPATVRFQGIYATAYSIVRPFEDADTHPHTIQVWDRSKMSYDHRNIDISIHALTPIGEFGLCIESY